MKSLTIIAAAALAAVGTGAQAQTTSIAAGFGTSVFSYGSGTVGSSFNPFSQRSACGSGLDCFNNGTSDPGIYKNNNATATMGQVVTPAGGLHLHPGPSNGQDAIIRFTAAVAGTYALNGSFGRINTSSNGDGVNASIFRGATQLFSTNLAPPSFGSTTSFSLSAIALGVGDTLDFAVNRRGEYTFDSTTLSGTISVAALPGAVPEPATWTMLIMGFGAAGGVLRSRRKVMPRTHVAI